MLVLSEAAVQEIFTACQSQKADAETDQLPISSQLINNVTLTFSRPRLEEHRQLIADLLGQLPKPLYEPEGSNFLTGSRNSLNVKWTDKAMVIKKLFELGLATGYISPAPNHQMRQELGLSPAFVISRQVPDSNIVIRQYPILIQPSDYTVISTSRNGKEAQIVHWRGTHRLPVTLHVKRCAEGYRNKQGQIFLT